MKFLTKRAARLQRGATTIFFAFAMIPMVGVAAVALEFGNAAVHYRRLQNYVDSKAIAALRENFGNIPSDQRVQHSRFANGSATAGPGSPDALPVKGHWDFSVFNGAEQFTATPALNLAPGAVPAYRVDVESFTVNLLFGSLFNVPSVDIHVEAVAYAPRREVVIVQDVSGSMCIQPDGSFLPRPCSDDARIGPAKDADTTLVEAMEAQDIPGDMVGIVAFNDGVVGTPLDLTPLSTQLNTVTQYIDDLAGDGQTDVGVGIGAGNALFSSNTPNPEIARIMIVVGDGRGGSGAPQAANAAEALGADVYTIAFCGGGDCNDAEDFLDDLTRGNGFFRPAPDAATLLALMTDIVTGVPMKLVR